MKVILRVRGVFFKQNSQKSENNKQQKLTWSSIRITFCLSSNMTNKAKFQLNTFSDSKEFITFEVVITTEVINTITRVGAKISRWAYYIKEIFCHSFVIFGIGISQEKKKREREKRIGKIE